MMGVLGREQFGRKISSVFRGAVTGHTVAPARVMRPVRTAAFAALVALAVSVPARLAAVTVDQIVALSKSGVSDAVILALLDRDRTVLTIEPERLVALKREGLSDAVLLAMLKSGRGEAENAGRAVSAANAEAVLAAIDAAPGVVVVGHGPDRPNTIHTEDTYRGFRDGVRLPSALPYGLPYAPPFSDPFKHGFGLRAFPSPLLRREAMLCLAQVHTASGPGPAYVTECPAIMQPWLRAR